MKRTDHVCPIGAYYRVSTDKQGKSGHGLEAQRATVEAFARSHNWPIIGEFTEIETGKRNDRPQLNAALKACKKQKARLVIAKLDRLSRKLSFITMLIDSNIDFVCCDNPHATKLTVHILGAMGEHERDMIGKRTKEALAAAKQRGVVLGNSNVGRMNSEAAMARDAVLKPNDVGNAVARHRAGTQQSKYSCAPWRRVGSNIGDARHETLGHRRSVKGRPHPTGEGKICRKACSFLAKPSTKPTAKATPTYSGELAATIAHRFSPLSDPHQRT